MNHVQVSVQDLQTRKYALFTIFEKWNLPDLFSDHIWWALSTRARAESDQEKNRRYPIYITQVKKGAQTWNKNKKDDNNIYYYFQQNDYLSADDFFHRHLNRFNIWVSIKQIKKTKKN